MVLVVHEFVRTRDLHKTHTSKIIPNYLAAPPARWVGI